MRLVRNLFKYLLLYVLGGCMYYYIEVLIRGWSHWSMFLLGGLCYLFISIQNKIPWWDQKWYKQLIRCVVFILCGEFVTGCMVNLWLGWRVWDYTGRPFQLMGQICLPMAFIFGILALGGIWLDKKIRYYAFDEKW